MVNELLIKEVKPEDEELLLRVVKIWREHELDFSGVDYGKGAADYLKIELLNHDDRLFVALSSEEIIAFTYFGIGLEAEGDTQGFDWMDYYTNPNLSEIKEAFKMLVLEGKRMAHELSVERIDLEIRLHDNIIRQSLEELGFTIHQLKDSQGVVREIHATLNIEEPPSYWGTYG
jgi:hypothetical protein